MTDEERLPSSRSSEAPRPSEQHASEHRASDFERVERAGAEAMAERPKILDRDGRVVSDPGQDARAPEEQSSVRQARLDPDEQHISPPEASR